MNGKSLIGNLESSSRNSLEKMEWITLVESGKIIDNSGSKDDSNERDIESIKTTKVFILLQYK